MGSKESVNRLQVEDLKGVGYKWFMNHRCDTGTIRRREDNVGMKDGQIPGMLCVQYTRNRANLDPLGYLSP